MLIAPHPVDEAQRLQNLEEYNVLDTDAEREFDDITLLASCICQTPISIISLIDEDRQWFKSRVGIDAVQTDRDSAFCGHAILGSEVLVVPDARKDERFSDNPFVTQDPHIRFYAGTPLVSAEGYALGTLCVIDQVPRELTADQLQSLKVLGRQVVSLLNLRRAMSRSLDSEQFARETVDALTAHIAILDHAGTIVAVNRAWSDFAAKNPPTPAHFGVGANYLSVCEGATGPCSEDAHAVALGIRAVLGNEQDEFALEYPCHSPTERRWFVARVSRFAGDGPSRVVVAHENVTKRREAEEHLRHVSLHDALTGLPNRVLFADRVDQALLRLRRDPSRHFAVLFIDLDRFKIINDSIGHAAGDVVLTTIAARLQACLRSTDSVMRSGSIIDSTRAATDAAGHTVGRMGGDEFTLVLDSLNDPRAVVLVAERVLNVVSQPIAYNGHELTTTASIGIVNGTPAYNSSQELLRDADSAMYRAKTSGKARYAVFDSTMHDAAVTRMQLENDLRHALVRGELLLHYQPVLCLSTRELKGFEALIRWRRNDADGGRRLVSPADFIPVAEDIGLIVPLGAWVLEEACRQMASWKRSHPAAANVTISVNVSGKQLGDDYFVGHLQNVLRTTQLDPACIRLEITESVIMGHHNEIIERLSALKATGVLLSMDDFGTGYSSLSCLHRFPIDVLKVDRSFVQNMGRGRHAAAVVHAVMGLAHNMGMVVVAEGVETPEQLAFLQSLDCDLGQGYLFSKPLPAEAAGRFLTEFGALVAAG